MGDTYKSSELNLSESTLLKDPGMHSKLLSTFSWAEDTGTWTWSAPHRTGSQTSGEDDCLEDDSRPRHSLENDPSQRTRDEEELKRKHWRSLKTCWCRFSRNSRLFRLLFRLANLSVSTVPPDFLCCCSIQMLCFLRLCDLCRIRHRSTRMRQRHKLAVIYATKLASAYMYYFPLLEGINECMGHMSRLKD